MVGKSHQSRRKKKNCKIEISLKSGRNHLNVVRALCWLGKTVKSNRVTRAVTTSETPELEVSIVAIPVNLVMPMKWSELKLILALVESLFAMNVRVGPDAGGLCVASPDCREGPSVESAIRFFSSLRNKRINWSPSLRRSHFLPWMEAHLAQLFLCRW